MKVAGFCYVSFSLFIVAVLLLLIPINMMMMIVPIIRRFNNNQRSMITKLIIVVLLCIINYSDNDHVRFVESFASTFETIIHPISSCNNRRHQKQQQPFPQHQQKSSYHICKCTNTKMMTTTSIASLAMTSAVLFQPILLSSRRNWNNKKSSSLSLAKRIWPVFGSSNNDDNNEDEDDSNNTDNDNEKRPMEGKLTINNSPLLLRETSKILQRTSFIAWWSQIILTTIASIILLFAQSITGSTSRSYNPLMMAGANSIMKWYSPRYILSTLGIITSAFSILWTWGNGNRLSKRIIHPNKILSNVKVANMLRRSVRVGIIINLIGLLLHLIAGQEIIGKLAIKVLTLGVPTMYNSGGGAMSGISASSILDNTLQPIDILVVQANNNSLLSHFISLTCHLYLTNIIKKIDPSSSSTTTNNNE